MPAQTCHNCRTALPRSRSDRRFCSPRCKQAAWLRRQREAHAAALTEVEALKARLRAAEKPAS